MFLCFRTFYENIFKTQGKSVRSQNVDRMQNWLAGYGVYQTELSCSWFSKVYQIGLGASS